MPKYDDLTSKSQYFVEYFSQDADVEFWRKKSDDSNSCRNEKREKVLVEEMVCNPMLQEWTGHSILISENLKPVEISKNHFNSDT